MNLIKKIIAYIKNPAKIINYFGSKGKLKFIPDKLYLKIIYRARMGEKLNINNPKTYNEKLQWLKLHDRKPEYIQMVDKYEVREYIRKTIGEEHLIPLIGIYNNFNEIDFSILPNQFVLKCTHDSGGKIICKDKSKLSIKATKRQINKDLKKNYYYSGREWPYKYIKPRIICEKYMVDESGVELKDYKFFCFGGEPNVLFVASDRENDIRYDYYDIDFNHQPFTQQDKNSDKKIEKPLGFDKMIELSRILSKNIPHVRVDFYDVHGTVYFGELTFYNESGFGKFEPEIYDAILGSWIQLK
jgi:hypothetical protein